MLLDGFPVTIASVIEPRARPAHDGTRKETSVTPMALRQQDDPDVHKGAIEGDRPTDEQIGNPHGDGINDDGLPDDPIAIAEDVEGANEDQSQG
jgi:hypothetical protein